MDKRKLYRGMAAVSAAVSLAAVGVISVTLVMGPVTPAPDQARQAGPAAGSLPEISSESSAESLPESAPETRSAAKKPDKLNGALDAFIIPTDWSGRITLDGGTFYAADTYERFQRGESVYSGEILTVGAVPQGRALEAGTEKLAEREDAVYYLKIPGEVTFEFGKNAEADRDYFRMQNDLQDALRSFLKS